MDCIEFIEIASKCGMPAYGMTLSDERCSEYATHFIDTFTEKSRELKMKMIGNLPIVRKGSQLNLCPVITRVNLFPIEEDAPCDVEETDAHRPLFYYEMDGSRHQEMQNRHQEMQKRSKRSKKLRFDRSPILPKRRGNDEIEIKEGEQEI